MCGIAGWVTRQFIDRSEAVLQEMTDVMSHRGPDASGTYLTCANQGVWCVGLGHRRLSIIDLSGGSQPMHDPEAGLSIVFNGEIYNYRMLRAELRLAGYRFETESDTEVLLRAYRHWGKEMLSRLRGMFAFGIWDARREELFLARDRFGKKPLFVHRTEDTVVFASEIKSLLTFPGIRSKVDYDAVWEYLAYRYVPGPLTLLQGIHKLPPGSWATWQEGKWQETRYYTTPDHQAKQGSNDYHHPVDHFLGLLEDAVSARMVSDVPFGAFLSGGIDSSAVVSLMARHSDHPINTFSVGFEESAFSELAYARMVAETIGTTHHELVISQHDIVEYLPRLISLRGAPLSEPSDIPIYCLANAASRSVKMVLTGEGSDEMLGGYPKHVFERYADIYQCIPSVLRKGLMEPLAHALPYRFKRIKTAATCLGVHPFAERMPSWFGALTRDERAELVSTVVTRVNGYSGRQFDAVQAGSDLRKILYFDQTSWLPDNLLERGDSMMMAASIEGRMPFMDHELLAYVSSLSDHWRVRGLQTKYILRQAMRHVLPEKILQRRKVGFRVPVHEWFRNSLREYLLEHLRGPDSLIRGYFNPQVLDQKINEHLLHKQNHEKLLWTLLNLEVWHRQYRPQQ